MAIAINGSSNTITGIAVGGLPDGIVDTDMLAANAVNLAKLGATSGVNGPILQVVTSSNNNSITTSGAAISDLTNVSITPSSASNKILLVGTCGLYTNASGNAYAGVYFHRGTSSGTLLYQVYAGYDTASSIYFPYAITFVDTPNTTSAQTYTFSFSRQSISTSSVATNGLNYSLTALEIAG